MRRPPAALGSLLVLALLAAACARSAPVSGAGASGPTKPDPTSPAGPTGTDLIGPSGSTAPAEPTRVPEILRFETQLVGGGTLHGSELAGAPVALWFWAPW